MKNKNENFSVAVIATMSSGKSTTLNAMLGVPLLPSKNEACTATVCKIEDMDGMKGFRARAVKKGGETTEWENIQCEDSKLDEWNSADYASIEIQGDFPHIDNYKHKIRFYDTSGPNNASDKSHSEITNNILENSDYSFVVCVMNASQFGVDGEKKLLEDIKKNIEKKKLETKIVFAINRINDLDLEKESMDTLIDNIQNCLIKEIGFKSPTIIPVNSLLSLNIRTIINAHKNNQPLEFSPRKQKKLYREIKYFEHFRKIYRDAIFSSKKQDKQSFFNRAATQDRKVDIKDLITLGNKQISIEELIDVDITTGIPFLEEMLEIELINFKDNLNHKTNKKKLPIKNKKHNSRRRK